MLRKITRLVPFVIFMLLLSPLALADRSDGNDDSSGQQSSSNHGGSNDDNWEGGKKNDDNREGGKKPVAVPEPSTIALGATGLLGIAGAMRRKFRA